MKVNSLLSSIWSFFIFISLEQWKLVELKMLMFEQFKQEWSWIDQLIGLSTSKSHWLNRFQFTSSFDHECNRIRAIDFKWHRHIIWLRSCKPNTTTTAKTASIWLSHWIRLCANISVYSLIGHMRNHSLLLCFDREYLPCDKHQETTIVLIRIRVHAKFCSSKPAICIPVHSHVIPCVNILWAFSIWFIVNNSFFVMISNVPF